jgi:hypothetical protein
MTATEMLTAALAASNLIEFDPESNDLVWDLLCRYEDGDDSIWTDAKALSDKDRRLLQSETAIVDAKRMVEAEKREIADAAWNRHYGQPSQIGISCPKGGVDYEGRILAQAEVRYFGE